MSGALQRESDFLFRLCRELKCPHPEFLGDILTLRQVNDWIEHYAREPWGFQIDDTRAALLAFTVARSAGSKRARLNDFRIRINEAPLGREAVKDRARALFGGSRAA